MKVIDLTMNAFMSYKEKTTLHFDDFIQQGLYLISGPTGSGKTTIFDAITFALYGEASGTHRQQAYFRSDFAEAKEETYVELTFELHQCLYKVRRSPTYLRKGYKTPKQAQAYLQYDDIIVEGIKEVNEKINQLLGVNAQQFKQIVMIAQGEFTKLIYASSEEREKVLRHLFHSDILVTFENLLRDKTKIYKEQFLLSNQSLQTQFQMLSLPTDFMQEHSDGFHVSYIQDAQNQNQILFDEVTILHQQYLQKKEQYELYEKEYYELQKKNQDLLEYEKLEKQYHQLLTSQKQMDILSQELLKLKVIEDNQTLIDHYNHISQDILKNQEDNQKVSLQIQQVQSELKDIDQKYLQISQMKKQKEDLLLEIETIKQAIQTKQHYQSLENELHSIKGQHQNKQEDYQKLFTKHQSYQKRIERDQENVDRLPHLQEELSQNEIMVKEMNQRRISIHELSELYDQYTQSQDKHFELSQIYHQKQNLYQQSYLIYQQEDEKFKQQQAGILALTLKENQPCPVCGSLHHPNRAKLSSHVLSAHDLEQLRQKCEVLKQDQEDIYQEVLLQNNQVQEIKAKIELLKKQLDIEDELSKQVFIRLLSQMTQITKEQEKTYYKRQSEVEYLKKIKRSLSQDYILFQQESKTLEEQHSDLHELELKMSSLQSQLIELENRYKFSNHKDLDEQLKSQTKLFQKIDKQISQIETDFHQKHKDLSVFTHHYDLLLQQEETLCQQKKELEEKIHIFIKNSFESQEQYENIVAMRDQLKIKETIYQNYLIEKQSLENALKRQKDICQNHQQFDLTSYKIRLLEQEQQKDQCFQSYHTKNQTYLLNQEFIQQMTATYQKNQDIFEKYTIYQDLLDNASGKNHLRMSFERYVLSSYFEHILDYANIELLKMSRGKFALYRKQSVKGVKQQGLDLWVLDYETGMMRDVQSLSGGESFQAALSLALGLSTMIQSYAGGIELNTLFIDEGFGSLDGESIDQALSVLLDLKNDNKMIGIISHVDELKERIATQIVVSKGVNGSYLSIVKE